jgi:hypothetical protein
MSIFELNSEKTNLQSKIDHLAKALEKLREDSKANESQLYE